MGSRIVLEIGDRYGRLTFIKDIEPLISTSIQKRRRCLWQCDCGGTKEADLTVVRSGGTSSCGCARIKHGFSKRNGLAPEYRAWIKIKERCCNPTDKNYYRYGGSGKKIWGEWENSFIAFYEYVGPKPKGRNMSIDRIDNRLGYQPGNVRWATKKQQSRNTSQSKIWTTPLGEFETAKDAANAHKVSESAIRDRVNGLRGNPPKPGYTSRLRYLIDK